MIIVNDEFASPKVLRMKTNDLYQQLAQRRMEGRFLQKYANAEKGPVP